MLSIEEQLTNQRGLISVQEMRLQSSVEIATFTTQTKMV